MSPMERRPRSQETKVYSFSIAALINYCKFSGLKQHKNVFSYTSGGQKSKMSLKGLE